ncbi:MAG: hypothetical protein NC099_03320 [Corallococcus sp.]|nr:hypothetical protein [Corallococcus sp.]
MSNDIEKLKRILLRADVSSNNDDEQLDVAYEKLTHILQDNFANEPASEQVGVVQTYMVTNDVQKRKLLSYCEAFVDPTVHKQSTPQGEQVCQHAFLKQDELYMLYQFVKRHQNDMSFGETVYKIMDRHGMTAPQVYKNVLLRRQDFARVTDPRCKNVTRKMAWQIIVGLHCSLEEADDVLFSAGYIRRNTRMDLTMQYFIECRNYDIVAIDAVLADFGLKTFACE